jgi:hypothetical protein
MFDGDDIAPQAAAVLSKRNAAIRDGTNILAQIGVAAAVAIPVLAWMNAEMVVFCKVSVDAPAAIFGPGRDVLAWTSGVNVAYRKIETVGWRDEASKMFGAVRGCCCDGLLRVGRSHA